MRKLSMPEQQLVEIARSLGAGARILIMDEPTASLTQNEVHLLYAVVRDLRAQGVGVIYISHRMEEIFALADRVTVLRDGESIATQDTKGMDESTLIKLMVGREVSSLYPPSETAPAGVTLSVQGSRLQSLGVHDVNLDLRAGEVVGFAGIVGAGRTELARVLFGITPADTGTISLGGKAVSIQSPREAVEHGIGYVPEDRRRHGVILEMPVATNMTMAIHPTFFPVELVALRGRARLGKRLHSRSRRENAIWRTFLAAALSGGNQQKVSLARWLATKPKVLILDEPTQGVDVGAKSEIHKIIRRLTNEGLAVMMISSDLAEVLGMSDRIAVMHGGTIVKEFSGAEANPHDVMAAALGQEPSNGKGLPASSLTDVLGIKDVTLTKCHRMKRYFREWSVFFAFLAILLLLAFRAPDFFRPAQLLSMLCDAVPVLIAACGMTLVIVCRQIDISIGSQFALCSVFAGLAASNGLPMPVVAVVAILSGAAMGAFNGVLVAGLGSHPLS